MTILFGANMTGYKSLNHIIGARHFPCTYVCPAVEQAIAAQRPADSEFLTGRIVHLDANKTMLILVFELTYKRDTTKSINLPMTLRREEGKKYWFELIP